MTSFPLSEVSDLGNDPLQAESGDPVVHHVYVAGEALNESVDSTRTHFTLADGEALLEAALWISSRSVKRSGSK